ncbi:MAG: hypothetical protein NTY04_03745 [Candidatus Staskawiczbacteria bacterium]|nr:hypothetical protein [Candidatus Staskawiczbacteria bacterium]
MSCLPNAIHFLTDDEKKVAIFVKPKVESVCATDSIESPGSTVLAIREFWLQPNSVVPFHVHGEKEKFYIFHGLGPLVVTIMRNGAICEYRMRDQDKLVIPPGCPHFLKYFPDTPPTPCKVLVVASSQDAKDISWQDGAD